MLLERLLILLVIAAAGAALYGLWRLWQARRLQQLHEAESPDPVRNLTGSEGPAILYFTAEDCTQCRYRQSPILSGLVEQFAVTVHTVDAPSEKELVRHYGIMTVPSTVILNKELRPAAINHGLADPVRLREQLGALESSPAASAG